MIPDQDMIKYITYGSVGIGALVIFIIIMILVLIDKSKKNK